MNSLAVFALLAILVLSIGALAIAGVRKARAMSKGHVAKLKESGDIERLESPRTMRDHFLRPMSWKDVVLGLLGAVVLMAVLRGFKALLGG